MQNELLALIDQVQMQTEDAEYEVLESMMEVYTKSMMIMESLQDVSGFELFMEADENATTNHDQDGAPIRSQSGVAKFVRMMKRLWQQILTMVSNAILNSKIKKLRTFIEKNPRKILLSPVNEETIKAWISTKKKLKNATFEDPRKSIETVVEILKSTAGVTRIAKNIIKNDKEDKAYRGNIVNESVPTQLVLEWLDVEQEWFKNMQKLAKNVDKELDAIRNNDTPSEDDMLFINNGSKIIFEALRAGINNVKRRVDELLTQFQTNVYHYEVEKITFEYIESMIKRIVKNMKIDPGKVSLTARVWDQHSPNIPDGRRPTSTLPEGVYVIIYKLNNDKYFANDGYAVFGKTMDPDLKKRFNKEGYFTINIGLY